MPRLPEVAQVAAIPFRQSAGGIEALLIRRPPGGAWGVPKGVVDPGRTVEEAGRAEAVEEAGAEGDWDGRPAGEFVYEKRFTGTLCIRRVRVFFMRVNHLLDPWPEQAFRERRWFPLEAAAAAVERPPVKAIIRELGRRLGSPPPPGAGRPSPRRRRPRP